MKLNFLIILHKKWSFWNQTCENCMRPLGFCTWTASILFVSLNKRKWVVLWKHRRPKFDLKLVKLLFKIPHNYQEEIAHLGWDPESLNWSLAFGPLYHSDYIIPPSYLLPLQNGRFTCTAKSGGLNEENQCLRRWQHAVPNLKNSGLKNYGVCMCTVQAAGRSKTSLYLFFCICIWYP